MRLSQLLQDVKILSPYEDREIANITDDSRKVEPGAAYVCIRGEKDDGSRYVNGALAAGAAAVVTERDLRLPEQVLVEDARKAYAAMCAAYFGHPARRLRLIGVTGTNGKTTTANLIKHILEENGETCGLIGTIEYEVPGETFASHLTTPGPNELNSLLKRMADAGCGYAVMEVSSHALDQERVHGLHFSSAVFTNLTQDHLDYHKTMERYFEAKARLFGMCGRAVVNADDPYGRRLMERVSAPLTSFSMESDGADFTAKNIRYSGDRVNYLLLSEGVLCRVEFASPGSPSVYNSLAAITCAAGEGISRLKAAEAICTAKGVRGRMEMVPTGRDFHIMIDYAHTPDGLENVLKSVRGSVKGRLVLLFGCGGDRDRTKRPLRGEIAGRLADFVVVTSDNPRTEPPGAIIEDILKGLPGRENVKVVENRAEAIKWVIENARADDIILLAGKGHETYQILNGKTIPFDERQIIGTCLKNL